MHSFPHLLSPIRVGRGKTVLKNRLIFPNASPHRLQGPETFPAEGYRAFMSNLARAGAAAVTVAEWGDIANQRNSARDRDACRMQAFDLDDPSVHNYLSQLAEEVHFFGSKIIIDINVEKDIIPEGYSVHGGIRKNPMTGETTEIKRIPVEMMPEIYEKLVERCRFYQQMGYDGFATRVDYSMVPDDENERDDEYGGDILKRTRFIREAYHAVRKALGDDFILLMEIAYAQPLGYTGNSKVGFDEEECLTFLKAVDDFVDIVHMREKDIYRCHPTGYCFTKGDHPAVDACARFKKAGLKVLMQPIGGFQDPYEMEEYIRDGKCDLFGVARGFFADPEWLKKCEEDRADDIIPCLWCNRCHGVITDKIEPWVVHCSLNPKFGLDSRLPRMLEGLGCGKKKVAVIGGGPAGMRAALYADAKGHEVTLYEKTGALGGQLAHAEFFSFKWPLKNYRDWLVAQLGKSSVRVVMNCEPSRDEIKAGGYDAVFAATGAVASIPAGLAAGVTDADGKLLPGIYDTLSAPGKEAEMGQNVVVIGGGEAGTETAMYLAEAGHNVTILTRQKELAHNASHRHYITVAYMDRKEDGYGQVHGAWEKYPNLKGILNATTTSVEPGRVCYTDAAGEHVLEADSVVICGGTKPLLDEALFYSGLSSRFSLIGDCNGGGNLQACNREAYAAVETL